jgi:CysZ protein
MIDAAVKALNQMLSPPFRAVLLKSMGLAVVVLIVIAIGLHRLLAWLASSGAVWVEGTLGSGAETPLNVVLWVFTIAAALGLFIGMIFLTPAATSAVAGLFADEIAELVERTYPGEPVGTPLTIPRALLESAKFALLSIGVYLGAMPFLLIAGLGAVMFFFATAYLQGRQYFALAATRFHPPAEAKALRKAHRGTVFGGGLLIAAFLSIPIVNLATPLFGTAFMVHLHKRMHAEQRERIAARR